MKDILFEWNPWWSADYSFDGVKREKLDEIIPWLEKREIISVIGVRRGGKTTLFYEIIDYLIKKRKVSKKNILFVKADDDRIKREELIDAAIHEYQQWINQAGAFFLFIDEVQEIPNWQRTIKRIYDLNKNIKILISGSNTSVLKEELSSLLAGRFAYFEVFPFSFSEFLAAKKIEIKNEAAVFKNRNVIRKNLIEYLASGSFPEIALEEKVHIKEEMIKFYFDSIFYRDIIKRKNIRNPAKMENLIKYFLQNISALSNFSKIARLLDLSADSVVEYVKILEDAYLLFNVSLFEASYKKQIINPKKIYCIDSGIRNIIGFKFSEDIGKLYENAVFMALRRKNREIYYWKNKNECDFLVKKGKELSLIQVCCTSASSEAMEREMKGLAEAMGEFNVNEAVIITEDYEKTEKSHNKKIRFIPLWKWLLDSSAPKNNQETNN